MSRAERFAVALATLYAAHEVGDQWVQTHRQACTKGGQGDQQRAGQAACARHVAGLTAAKAVMLAASCHITRTRIPPRRAALALTVDALSHYAYDRRWTAEKLAGWLGKSDYYRLGQPRPGHDDNLTIGTGAYALDQAWHTAWLWATALIMASGESR